MWFLTTELELHIVSNVIYSYSYFDFFFYHFQMLFFFSQLNKGEFLLQRLSLVVCAAHRHVETLQRQKEISCRQEKLKTNSYFKKKVLNEKSRSWTKLNKLKEILYIHFCVQTSLYQIVSLFGLFVTEDWLKFCINHTSAKLYFHIRQDAFKSSITSLLLFPGLVFTCVVFMAPRPSAHWKHLSYYLFTSSVML